MSQDSEKANIILTKVSIPIDARASFVDWQAKLQHVIAKCPGFLSLEILAPNEQESAWTIVQRFSDPAAASSWQKSAQQQELFNELRSINKQDFKEVLSEERTLRGVTEVIITEVSPEKKSTYQQWLAKIHQAEVKFPGFRGMYVQAPIDTGRFWITFLQFDTTENLDKWLASVERQEILKELDPLIKSIESHRIISPYAGWFGSIAKIGGVVSVCKQTMLVLLVLFPIVMLQLKYLNPWTKSLDISLSTFIGNAISVSLIAWPMMPIAIFFFSWWLSPQAWTRTKINLIGTLILLVLYTIEIIIFSNLFNG